MKGTYVVDVTQDGRAIAGSPFKINVDDRHVCNAGKVKVSGAIKEATANKWNDVTLVIDEAGKNMNFLLAKLIICHAELSKNVAIRLWPAWPKRP